MIRMKVLLTRNRIPELRAQLRPRAGRAINEWARNVLGISQQLVNVGERRFIDRFGNQHPGFLKKSGHIEDYVSTVGDGRQSGVAKMVGYSAPYAKFVHNGTAHYLGNPYLLTAFEACHARLLSDLEDLFRLD